MVPELQSNNLLFDPLTLFRRHVQLPSLNFFTLFVLLVLSGVNSFAQKNSIPSLEKWPADLETDFALSALPARLRANATVYLLDPQKGYIETKTGTNGFVCFVLRTEWERSDFRDDLATAISFDRAGNAAIFSVFRDVAEMRAVEQFSPAKLKLIVESRFKSGQYKEPDRAGLSYMLAPLMRSFTGPVGDTSVATFSAPHYMTYAPHINNDDIGGDTVGKGPMVLGDGKAPHGYIMFPVGKSEKEEIMSEGESLLHRLVMYKPYFSLKTVTMGHH